MMGKGSYDIIDRVLNGGLRVTVSDIRKGLTPSFVIPPEEEIFFDPHFPQGSGITADDFTPPLGSDED